MTSTPIPQPADILPFTVDHAAPRYVRPLSPEHCARALNDQEMLEAIEAQLRGELRPVRHITIASRRDRWTRALAIAATTAIVFVLLVGALAVTP